MRHLLAVLCVFAVSISVAANPLLPVKPAAPQWTEQQQVQGYVLWTCDSTEPFFGNLPPSQQRVDSDLKCVTPPGEYEPLIIGIYALRDRGCIRLFPAKDNKFSAVVRRVHFQQRLVPPAPTGLMRLEIPFYLPMEQEGQLDAGKNTVYWITIHVPKETTPGIYKETLKLGLQEIDRTYKGDADDKYLARDRYGNRYIDIPYTVEVLPFVLPELTAAFGVYTVGGRRPKWAWTPEYERLCAEDIAAHGHNSTTTGSWLADTGFHVTGKVKLEGSELERRIELRMKAGLLKSDIPFLYFGASPSDAGSLEKYCEFARQLKEAFQERGWPEPILYGPDEPGPKALVGCGPALLAVQKHARTGTALKAHGELEYNLGKYFSVWIIMGRTFGPEIAARAKRTDRALWTYDCYHRGTNPVFHRFYAGIYTWAHRLGGNWLWAYTHTPEACWEENRTDHRGLISPSRGGPIPMTGWEARREGIEDFRTFTYLEELALAKVGNPIALEVIAWLAELRAKVPWQVCTDGKGRLLATDYSSFWWDMTDLLNPCMEIKPEAYAGIRAKAQSYIMQLEKK